jgi:peptidyl-prolyl cis-trans isomerase C
MELTVSDPRDPADTGAADDTTPPAHDRSANTALTDDTRRFSIDDEPPAPVPVEPDPDTRAAALSARDEALDEARDADLRDEALDEPRDTTAPASHSDADEPADEDEPADDGRSRPSLPVIIASVLLLVAIGAGLAFLMPSGPIREVDQLVPTSDPAAAIEVPTALPLPELAPGDEADVVVQVGEGQITRGDFVRLYQPGTDPTELLEQLIRVELVVQAAEAEGVTTDEAALDEQVAQIRAEQAGGDQAAFEAFLQQVNVGTEEDLRRLLARDQVVQEMILRHTTGEQVRARHILIATDTITDTDTARLEAEDLVAQLDDGADFAALAAEYSADTGSAANGGDLGWALRGSYVPEFDEAVFTMQPGERRLVQTQFGFHIIEVTEPAETSALKNADQLQSSPGQQAFADTFLPWVEELRSRAEADNSVQILIPAEELVITPPAAQNPAP